MVEVEVRGRVVIMTIRRPEARNAVNQAVAVGMEEGIDRLEDDDDLWVGIVAAEGPVFSAGADLKEVAADNIGALVTKRGGFAGIANRERSKPMIAAVDGPALAGGCEIALSCDAIVASRQAAFGIPEVKRSLVAAAGGLFRLPRVLPRNIALEMAMTGDPIDAERAYGFGMVNQLVEPGEVIGAALALADRICANAPLAVRASRRVVLDGANADDAAAWEMTNAAMANVFGSEDFQEGPRAFIEKRAPNWKGK
jgi:enoyl-CoA hydratase